MDTVDSVQREPELPKPRPRRAPDLIDDDPTWVVYTPESPLRHPIGMIRQIVAGFVAGRELAWRLFIRNVKSQYRQSLLGYAWAFLPPIVTTFVFVFLKSQKVINFDSLKNVDYINVNYTAFLLTGIVLWQTFNEALNAPLRLVGGSRAMLAKVNFPREALLITAFAEVVFNLVIRLVLVVGVFVWFQPGLPSTLLLVPLGMLALIGLGMSIGVLLVPLGILYSDVGRAMGLVSGFWMFVTPVVYPPPQTLPGSLVVWINPVSPVLSVCRDWLLLGETSYLPGFMGVMAGSLLLLLVGLVIYRLSMPILIERMSA